MLYDRSKYVKPSLDGYITCINNKVTHGIDDVDCNNDDDDDDDDDDYYDDNDFLLW